jgi:hypothetical protein
MDPVSSIPDGYLLGKNQRITDVLAVEDELLRSEGIDPTWVPFTEAEFADADSIVSMKPATSISPIACLTVTAVSPLTQRCCK